MRNNRSSPEKNWSDRQYTKKEGPLARREPPEARETGSATAAAAGEQQDDEDDPDPVVVVEHVAQTVVHSEPPRKNMK